MNRHECKRIIATIAAAGDDSAGGVCRRVSRKVGIDIVDAAVAVLEGWGSHGAVRLGVCGRGLAAAAAAMLMHPVGGNM